MSAISICDKTPESVDDGGSRERSDFVEIGLRLVPPWSYAPRPWHFLSPRGQITASLSHYEFHDVSLLSTQSIRTEPPRADAPPLLSHEGESGEC
jgi:hypothetical protein